jgi:hypothetical protein
MDVIKIPFIFIGNETDTGSLKKRPQEFRTEILRAFAFAELLFKKRLVLI